VWAWHSALSTQELSKNWARTRTRTRTRTRNSPAVAGGGAALMEARSRVRVRVRVRVSDYASRSARQSLTSMATIRSSSFLPRRFVCSAMRARRRQTSNMAADSVAEPMAMV